MRKLFASFFFFIVIFFSFFAKVGADGEFATDVSVEYAVGDNGITKVTNNIRIENLFSDLYVTSYSLSLDNINPQNISVFEGSNPLNFSQSKDGTKTAIAIAFPNAVVGKGKTRNFSVTFEEPSFAVRTGEVWEISIPRLSPNGNFRSYEVSLKVPASLGSEAYVSPVPNSVSSGDGVVIYKFDKEAIEKTGVTAGFGAFQVFSYTLNYHLENPLSKSASVDIALPPDTALQRVYYQSLSPKPENVYIDEDGNWLATYILKPRERVDVEAKGSVQIFAGPRPYPAPTNETLMKNLVPSEFWQSDDPQIKSLAESLKTPRAIYDYVWQNLSYDYQRVRPNVERLGAKAALSSPGSAICMEFTDLFIALSRAAGIPAREINGYAYTENPEIQPLSLVADVLHSWPEYWDATSKAWIPIDPTWASTTGGVDFFSKLDLRHFTFVVHGIDATKPYPPGSYKLGPNPQKDVFVSFGSLPDQRVSFPDIEVTSLPRLPLTPGKYEIKVTNPGPVALYNLTPTVSFNGKEINSFTIEVLPPYGVYETKASVPYSFLGKDTPEKLTVSVADKKVEVSTNKNRIIIESFVLLSIFLFAIGIFVLIKAKRIHIQAITSKISNISEKIKSRFRRNGQNNQKDENNTIPPQGY